MRARRCNSLSSDDLNSGGNEPRRAAAGNVRKWTAFADNAGVIGLVAFILQRLYRLSFDCAELLRCGDTTSPRFFWDIGCHARQDDRV
jgi:hypothetical protein